ncbi:hypothetical protein A2U01_0005930 [Trifolium medium]|uniref:Uncharacterized protein n=1 Tax=Trifolium medium TaxID=97028 RepID=A0A392ME90_9FABA|nr:hypothetical protein [Trifolium medium]
MASSNELNTSIEKLTKKVETQRGIVRKLQGKKDNKGKKEKELKEADEKLSEQEGNLVKLKEEKKKLDGGSSSKR